MSLFYQPDPVAYLTEADSAHAVRTLRLGAGDAISVTDGRGTCLAGQITEANVRRCAFRETDRTLTPARPFAVRLCVAPTKNPDRMEWLVEKATEIGVERISFFISQHSERRVLKLDRLEKIAVAAMKQSLQLWLPVLDKAVPFAELVSQPTDSQQFIAHLPANAAPVSLAKATQPGQTYAVLIGPEGDFSLGELAQAMQAGFIMVTLGPNRLRTETAALVACQVINVLNGW